MSPINYRVAATSVEREGHFAVRHAVFVEEQQLFEGTDRDAVDEQAVHIVAVEAESGAVVGAVRCFPADDEIWYGSRLAVTPTHRRQGGSIGSHLCRLAEQLMVERSAGRFLAFIQIQNVRFFKHLGWLPVGKPVMHCGVEHQIMEAALHRERGTWQPGPQPRLPSESASSVAGATR